MAPTGNPAPAINHPPVGLGNDTQDGEFDDDVLDTLVPDLVPDLGELELLHREVQYQKGLRAGLEVPTVRQIPLSERSANYIMRGAFPTLFLTMVLGESSTFVACLHKQIPFVSILVEVRKQSPRTS